MIKDSAFLLLGHLMDGVVVVTVRLSKDRLELVRQAVASKPTNYKQSQKVGVL